MDPAQGWPLTMLDGRGDDGGSKVSTTVYEGTKHLNSRVYLKLCHRIQHVPGPHLNSKLPSVWVRLT